MRCYESLPFFFHDTRSKGRSAGKRCSRTLCGVNILRCCSLSLALFPLASGGYATPSGIMFHTSHIMSHVSPLTFTQKAAPVFPASGQTRPHPGQPRHRLMSIGAGEPLQRHWQRYVSASTVQSGAARHPRVL
jgi:hypothetical protein